MAELKVEGAELKKMVKLGKKQNLAFGYCPGKGDDNTLVIHRRKSPEMLGKAARKEGSSPKVAFGTFEVKGRTMEMTCGRVVPMMAKGLKKYLKSQKVLVNVVILDAEGNLVDSDVEDLPPEPEDDAAEAAAAPETEASVTLDADVEEAPADDSDEDDTAPALDAAALATRLKALQPAIAAAEADVAAKLKKVMAGAVAQIKATALEQADSTIGALEAAVAKLSASAASPTSEPQAAAATDSGADLKALAARAQAIKAQIADVAPAARDKLIAALTTAAQQIKDRNLDAANTMLDRIEAALAKIAPAEAAPAQEGGANADVETYEKSRLGWIEARSNVRKEIEALKAEIDKTVAGQEGLEEVAAKSHVLFDHIKDLNGDLEDALQALVKTPDDAKRDALKANARQIVQTYEKILDSDFFHAVDDNGFIKTNIRQSAVASLQQVNAAIAA